MTSVPCKFTPGIIAEKMPISLFNDNVPTQARHEPVLRVIGNQPDMLHLHKHQCFATPFDKPQCPATVDLTTRPAIVEANLLFLFCVSYSFIRLLCDLTVSISKTHHKLTRVTEMHAVCQCTCGEP